MGIGDEAAEGTVAGALVVAVGEYYHPAGCLGSVVAVVIEDGEVDADDGVDACIHACFEVFDGSVKAVAVSAGEGGGAVGGCCLGKFLGAGDAVVGAEGC